MEIPPKDSNLQGYSGSNEVMDLKTANYESINTGSYYLTEVTKNTFVFSKTLSNHNYFGDLYTVLHFVCT